LNYIDYISNLKKWQGDALFATPATLSISF